MPINEAKNELFNTEEELLNYFSTKETYDQLLNLTRADNLIRKYTAKAYFLRWDKLLEFAYDILKKMKEWSIDEKESLDAAKEWAVTLRNVTNVFDTQRVDDSNKTLCVQYDVLEWYEKPERNQPLHEYKGATAYRIFSDKKYREMAKFVKEFAKQRKGDNEFAFGNFITRGYSLSSLWLQCERV